MEMPGKEGASGWNMDAPSFEMLKQEGGRD